MLVAAGSWALGSFGATPARADSCSDCPEPSMEEMAGVAGVSLDAVLYGGMRVYWDAGECRYSVMAPARKMNGILVLWEATGMAWNCPWGSSDSEVRVELGDTSQYTWTMTASGGLKLAKETLAEISASFGRTDELSHAQSVVASITNPIKAGVGKKVHWHGYYFAGRISATAEVIVERRFAWWTKTSSWTSTVRSHGDYWVGCGNGGVAGNRIEALSVSIAIQTYACLDTCCQSGNFEGWFPPPPLVPMPNPFPPQTEPGTEPTPPDAPPDDEAGDPTLKETPPAPDAPCEPPPPAPEPLPAPKPPEEPTEPEPDPDEPPSNPDPTNPVPSNPVPPNPGPPDPVPSDPLPSSPVPSPAKPDPTPGPAPNAPEPIEPTPIDPTALPGGGS